MPKRVAIILLSIVLASAVAGCAASPLSVEQARSRVLDGDTRYLRTAAESYTLARQGNGWQTEIDFEFSNPLARTIYVVNCHGGLNMQLQRLEAGEWVTVWEPVLLMCLSPPIRIDGGTVYRRTLRIWGAEPDRNTSPAFTTAELDGTYRLVWGSLVLDYDDRRSGFGDPVPLELRVSNSFELRQER